MKLPAYFTALNRDFRYQLTVIGKMAQAIIDQKIANNQFRIRTECGECQGLLAGHRHPAGRLRQGASDGGGGSEEGYRGRRPAVRPEGFVGASDAYRPGWS